MAAGSNVRMRSSLAAALGGIRAMAVPGCGGDLGIEGEFGICLLESVLHEMLNKKYAKRCKYLQIFKNTGYSVAEWRHRCVSLSNGIAYSC